MFFDNLNEYIWDGGNGIRIDDEAGLNIYEPVNSTYTRWIEEWIEMWNKLNKGFLLQLEVEDGVGYYISRISPKKNYSFPDWKVIEEEECVIDDDEAGNVSRYSCCDEGE